MIADDRTEFADPDGELQETTRAWDRARRVASRGTAIEIYTRRSRRVRVRIEPGVGRVEERGWDAGTTVRTHDPSTSRLGFAAASGRAAIEAVPLTRFALESAVHVPGASTPWSRRGEGVLRDLEPTLELPSSGRLSDWLERAAAGTARPATRWIEAAATVEAVAAEGLCWLRTRRRVWAVALGEGLPETSAARSLEALPRVPAGPDPAAPREGPLRGPLRFGPRALAVLVPSLVRALHGTAPPLGLEVGPGWDLRDDPRSPGAVVGGDFDDCGFEAVPRPLAAGGRVIGGVHGRGTLRRGSYRDFPESGPSLLVVTPPMAALSEDRLDVLSLRLEMATPKSWRLEMDGERWVSGRSAGGFRGAPLWTDPVSLAQACVAGSGEPATCGWGVLSPALIFEGLGAGE